MVSKPLKNKIRQKRHQRVRNTISGTPEIPRLSVFRSNRYIYAQIIDDVAGATLVSSSSKILSESLESTSTVEASKAVGKDLAQKAIEAGIKSVVFDRSGYVYHGRVKALADAAREAGLEF
ncbi:MAG: 50S ribosomal protein L18 [Eubacteriaceae bacterium]|nr:50S ribosomal protein L18 [Eubacteriaceae bacterium]